MSLQRSLYLAVLSSLLLGVTGSAHAQGRIEINQVRALAGGVTAGDTPGFPVTISEPGSYVLTSNLQPTGSADGIVLPDGLSGVTIDLAGFAILGPFICGRGSNTTTCIGGPAGQGIWGMGNNADITVKNGVVRGMEEGISLVANTNSRIEKVQATSNHHNGIALGSHSIVEDSGADLNGSVGIFVSDNSIVRNSVARNNDFYGIYSATACILSGNNVAQNGAGILSLSGSLLTGNNAYDNVSTGFTLNPNTGYTGNVLISNNGNSATTQTNPEVSGGIELGTGTNLCGTDKVCP